MGTPQRTSTPPTSPDSAALVTLSRVDLDRLLEQAVARGAAQALAIKHVEYLGNAEAAQYCYGRADRIEAWRALRLRYPEIDALSIGSGRLRRWKRSDLDAFLANKPRFRRKAPVLQGGAPM